MKIDFLQELDDQIDLLKTTNQSFSAALMQYALRILKENYESIDVETEGDIIMATRRDNCEL